MFISVFDIFKIGIGPSSSHTVGPMVAAGLFLQTLAARAMAADRIRVSLHGSLAFTGRGHGTDRAILLGLAGYLPATVDPLRAAATLAEIHEHRRIEPPGLQPFHFNPTIDLTFDFGPPLPGHPNGMRFMALNKEGDELLQQTYFSIGGGFVLLAEDLAAAGQGAVLPLQPPVPYPFATADEMLALGRAKGISIALMKRANEGVLIDSQALDNRLDRIWQVMADSLARGLATDGILAGGLQLPRRAKNLDQQVTAEIKKAGGPGLVLNEWLALHAMAVNEENAAGGRIVTAPTSGAAGVIPAVIKYYLTFYPHALATEVRTFLLVAAAIGGIIKHNGSISGAEVGCQGEIGSASAMAAAGLCAVLGGSNEQIENAAEIALEHHLGMTCDPVQGLVQVPCIERNGFGAVKAVTAATLALRGDGSHYVSLDRCIKTMYQTGLDMNEKYKETARGGLAVNLVDC
jgi:L-serine dehydratase